MPAMQHSAPRKASVRHQDLSQAAVSRAVLATTVQKPYVLYPAAIGILGAAVVSLTMLPALTVATLEWRRSRRLGDSAAKAA